MCLPSISQYNTCKSVLIIWMTWLIALTDPEEPLTYLNKTLFSAEIHKKLKIHKDTETNNWGAVISCLFHFTVATRLSLLVFRINIIKMLNAWMFKLQNNYNNSVLNTEVHQFKHMIYVHQFKYISLRYDLYVIVIISNYP